MFFVAAAAATDCAHAPRATEAPLGFSWVVDRQMAGLAYPGEGAEAAQTAVYLVDHGVHLLVTLTESSPPADAPGLRRLHLPVVDFQPPTQDQLDAFVAEAGATIAAGGGVAVHCAAGRGRTGTFLAAWLVARGATAPEAIARVRGMRPGSIESEGQEQAVATFAERR